MAIKFQIRPWKGLLHDASLRTKLQAFAYLLIVITTMTVMQQGFVSIDVAGEHLGYVLGLLGPVTTATLLLGLFAGTLTGLIAGSVLYIHSQWEPLDLYEHYLVTTDNSCILYTFAGLLLGFLLSLALSNDPQGVRRKVYFGLVGLVTSVVTSAWFGVYAMLHLLQILKGMGDVTQSSIDGEWESVINIVNGIEMQAVLDFLLITVVCIAVDHIARYYLENQGNLSVRSIFRAQLFAVTVLVFSVVQAASFVIITNRSEATSYERMGVELDYICDQLASRARHYRTLRTEIQAYDLPESVNEALMENSGVEHTLDGYDLTDGTYIIFENDVVVASYNPFYPVGTRVEDLFFLGDSGTLAELARAPKPIEIVYDTRPRSEEQEKRDDINEAQLGYMRVQRADFGFYCMMAYPAEMVFANRKATIEWASFLVFVLLATVYLLAMRLLSNDVVDPIDRTNASLAKITAGDLEEVVSETGTTELTSLSEGINTTVGTLKGWIAEAETRMERELATAKAIQESALPRVFPPFPEVDAFDIFASMDAAKEVGGDFYDFFLIDDRTLGFLIADVSGKGIPGALFMMAAKTEIENYLSTGMDPAQAIASANRRLCANNDAGMFVTVWAATFDWESGWLTYVNAGHNPPLLRRGSGGSWEWLRKKCGLFLGTFETAKYRQERMQLQPGDELLLYTDGVNEAFNMHEEEYGNDRLEAFLSRHTNTHPRELVRSLRSEVAAWADGTEQSDDVTILALEYGVAPEVTASLTVPATLDHLSEIIAFVSGELERRLCPLDVQHKIEIALEELVVNVCNYAYANQSEPGSVQVSYAYGANPSALTVELRDQGVPFDPLKREDPTKPSSIQDAKIGGLGILMVKKTMDDFVYLRDSDTNVVVFKKGW